LPTQELGKEEPAVTKTISKSTKSPEEIAAAIKAINFGAEPSAQIIALDALQEEGCLSLYKSAFGTGDLKSFDVSLSMLESRTGLTSEILGVGVEEVSLDDFKYATLWVTGGCTVVGVAALAFLPENVGATVCYLAALTPILFLGVGSTVPGLIAVAITGLKGSSEDKQNKADRVCRHEAAHFLCGYLCGLPIANYDTKIENIPRVEFHSTRSGPVTAQQELNEDEVNALTVVAMSGSVAEAMEYGKAVGGSNADLMELEGVFKRSANFVGAKKQQDLTRWGTLTAYRLLAMHKPKLDKLCEAFTAQKSVAECMAILEQ
jgi:hypothetical protein